jgi:hypothetical protein
MNKLEREMDCFNEFYTEINIKHKPKFKIGDKVFVKKDILLYIVDESNANKLLNITHGIIIGMNVDGELYYNSETDDITSVNPSWSYTIIIKNDLFRKDYRYKTLSHPTSVNIYEENEIKLLSELEEYIDECNNKKIDEIKYEKELKNELLIKKMEYIQQKLMEDK